MLSQAWDDLQVNVFLIQPPDAPTPVAPLDSAQGALDPFSPPWNLMCLQAFLQRHTRHISRFIDCRLLTDLEPELIRRLEELEPPRVLVINCPTLALGQVAAVLEIAKRNFPAMRTVLCGEYPSTFPEHVSEIPRADFALAGDPEPILRNLLDYLDIPQRLRRTPGLIMEGSLNPKPYRLPRLAGLALADWKDIFWNEYTQILHTRACRAEARMTRGHTGNPGDRAYGDAGSGLRQWPMDRFANLVSQCSHTEIKEIVLTDPPAFWTPDRLREWVQALLYIRNLQPWSLSILPMTLDDELVKDLRSTRCVRVEVIFPSCDRGVLAEYGIKLDWKEPARTFRALTDAGIRVYPRYWIGGPEEHRGEPERITQTINRFGLCDYRVEPFPLVIDSPLYEQQLNQGTVPLLDEWIKWAREPWIMERPVPLWGGRDNVDILYRDLKMIHGWLQRSPGMIWARLRTLLRSKNWIETLEDKAIAFLQRNRKPTQL